MEVAEMDMATDDEEMFYRSLALNTTAYIDDNDEKKGIGKSHRNSPSFYGSTAREGLSYDTFLRLRLSTRCLSRQNVKYGYGSPSVMNGGLSRRVGDGSL